MSGVDVQVNTCPGRRVTRQLSRERVTGPRKKSLTVDTIVCTSDSQPLIKRSLPPSYFLLVDQFADLAG